MAGESVFARVRRSFNASAGEIVFGMEDGAVSIFGLVFGVAATTDLNSVVLVAGISGAFAAAVSMMAGVFLDRQSESDQRRIQTEAAVAAVQQDPSGTAGRLSTQLAAAGLGAGTTAAVMDIVRKDPAALAGLAAVVTTGSSDDDLQQSPLGHALWMLVADLLASLFPVLPFALLPMGPARVVSVLLTAVLMLGLGVWRARIGRRHTVTTALQTLAIAAAAGIVGVVAGRLVDGWFGK